MGEGFSSSDDDAHYAALAPGSMLHEFRIEATLGHGGFGITYLAKDTVLDRNVAVKEFFPNELAIRKGDTTVTAKSNADRQDLNVGVQSFLEEARTLARFSHPNIVTVRRFFEANGTGYIVQDYVSGETLTRRLAAGPFDESEVRQLLDGLLDGLELIHNSAILHRDIKPDNIVLRDDGTPVLIDFGAARSYLSRHSRSITAIAAGGYTPPEQWGTGGQHGPWSDLYALGAVLYRCVTGESPPVSLQRLRKDPMVPAIEAAAGEYSYYLLDFIDWLLKVDEIDRPASVAEIRDRLDGRVAGIEDAPAPAVTSTSDAKRAATAGTSASPAAWPKWLWAAGAAAMLLLAVGAGAFVLQQRDIYETRFANAGDDAVAVQQFLRSCSLLCPSALNSAAQAKLAAIAAAQKEAEAKAAAEARAKAVAAARARDDAAARLQEAPEADRRRREDDERRAALERLRADELAQRAAEDRQRRDAAAEHRTLCFGNRQIVVFDAAVAGCTNLINGGTEEGSALAQAYAARGGLHYGRNDLDRAIADYDEAVRLNPAAAEAYDGRGNAFRGKGEYARAIADYNAAIDRNPSFSAAFADRGILSLKRDDGVSARADFDAALRLNAQNAAAMFGRGLVKQKSGEVGDAGRDFESAKAAKSDIALVFERLGLVPAAAPSVNPCAMAAVHWQSAEGIRTIAAYEDHLARFPNCAFASLAASRIETLKRPVIPLRCGKREVARDGACVAKTCPAGKILDDDGACVRRRAVATRNRTGESTESPAAAPRQLDCRTPIGLLACANHALGTLQGAQ